MFLGRAFKRAESAESAKENRSTEPNRHTPHRTHKPAPKQRKKIQKSAPRRPLSAAVAFVAVCDGKVFAR